MRKCFLGLMFLLLAISSLGAAQHDYVIDNAPGAAVRADLNSAFQAIVTNNAGATEPATLYPDMWWYDTSAALLKRRNNANDAWITLGLEAADTDGTLSANSDSKIPTQKAAKTYVDTTAATKAAKGANSDITSLLGLTTPLARSEGGLATTTANNVANGPVFLNASAQLPAVSGALLTNLPVQAPTAVSDTDAGTTFRSGAVTFLSVDKTITSGKTVLLIVTGWIGPSGGESPQICTLTLKQGSTTVQSVVVDLFGKGTGSGLAFACSGIVTGLSGSVTFSVTASSATNGLAIAYGNLEVIEF